ncbi:MAG: hypothetical protein ABI268_11460, partial [Rhodanobacter sp.]
MSERLYKTDYATPSQQILDRLSSDLNTSASAGSCAIKRSSIHLEYEMKPNRIILISGSIALALAMGSSAWATSVAAPSGPDQNATAPASPSSKDKILLAAAEPFENLTEMAFSSNWPKIDHTINEAKRLAAGAQAFLPQDAVAAMDAHLTAMTAARQKKNRADMALSSIEVYRVLVSSVSAGTKIPVQVSLLDYSGFRYDADLKSSPIRWDDMS